MRASDKMDWRALTIAVIGGDEREQEITRLAAATGATVRAFGFPWPAQGIERAELAPTAAAAMEQADFALFPIPGIAAEGSLFAPFAAQPIMPTTELLSHLRKPAHIILGTADDRLRSAAGALGIGLHAYEQDHDLTYLRGPAIVEGLLKVVIENTRFTIHRSRVCVVGHGIIGSLVTHTLLALGAEVHTAARNPVQRAAAYALGAHPLPLEDLPAQAPSFDMLFSTVPHAVVGRSVLEHLPAHCLVADLASPPGSIDLAFAKERGLTAVWARALSRRAPVTVGASQWQGIRPRIQRLAGIPGAA